MFVRVEAGGRDDQIGLELAQAFRRLGCPEGTLVSIEQARPPASLESVRRKIDGYTLSDSEIATIVRDVAGHLYSPMEIGAFLVACAGFMSTQETLALTRSMAWHPTVQFDVAEMAMELEAIHAQIESVTRDWSEGVQHPDWPIKIVATKYRAVEGAWRVVDRAMDVSGGFGMFKKSEMERLFRDARAGRFHPANSSLAHELIGKLALGVNPDDPQRWG